MSRSKNLRGLADFAERLGYTVKLTSKGHLRCSHTRTGKLVVCGSDPDGRALRNAQGDLERNARQDRQYTPPLREPHEHRA